MTSSDFRNSLIALACWRAAKHELHQVMLSVCMVFRNRAKAGWYEGDLYENVTRWLAENPGEFPDPRDPQFIQLLGKLDAVIEDRVPDKTDGAIYFVPKLNLEVLPEGSRLTTTIGQMSFVR